MCRFSHACSFSTLSMPILISTFKTPVGRESKDSHANANEKLEVAMGGMAEAKDVVKNEMPVGSPHQPQTFELRRNGYLALPRNLGSGVYDTGLTTQASGGLELFGFQNRDIPTGFGNDMSRGLRQSSIDTEPHTLATISLRHAVDGAVDIIKTYDEQEAVHLFLKDAEDESLREEALAAVLPVASELVT